MKSAIVYFSGTGNTAYIAKQIRDEINSRGLEASSYSIEDDTMQSKEQVKTIINEADLLFLGYPIYGSKAPKLMEEFIEKLPMTDKKCSVVVFTTVALASGDGPVYLKKLLENKGYELSYAREFIMNNNFNVPGFPDVLRVGSEDKVNKRLEKSRLRVKGLVDDLLSGKKRLQGNHLPAKLLGSTQRAHVDSLIDKISATMLVEHSRCTSCGICVRKCPVGNIEMHNGQIVLKDHCIGCMRCYHICKTEAINITKATLDGNRWPRFHQLL